MARSTLSFGMFAARQFWSTARSRGFISGSELFPSRMAMMMSLFKRANVFAIAAQRLNFRSFLNSNALPMAIFVGANIAKFP
jgi:hypothetical protein